jgi:hypothetical protein
VTKKVVGVFVRFRAPLHWEPTDWTSNLKKIGVAPKAPTLSGSFIIIV